MKKLSFCLLLFAVAIVACPLAFAAEMLPAHALPVAAVDSPVALFLQQTVFPIVTAFFMGIVSLFLTKLGAKYGIESLGQKNNLLERLAYQGITKAEELAAQYAGSRMALTGKDKLSIAVKHILGVMPKVTEEQAASMVHALLAQTPGVGALKDTAIERYPILSLAAPSVPAETPLTEDPRGPKPPAAD